MYRRFGKLYSSALAENMRVGIYGHGGFPVIFFSCGFDDAADVENIGLIKAVANLLESGRIRNIVPKD